MTDRSGEVDRPTNLAGIVKQLDELDEWAESITFRSGSSGNDGRCWEWIRKYREVRRWVETVAKKVAPTSAARINWSVQPPAIDTWQYFNACRALAQELRIEIATWEAEQRLFGEPPAGLVLLDAKTPFTSSLRIESLLAGARNDVWIADPYLTTSALEIMLAAPPDVDMKLLGRERPPSSGQWENFRKQRGGDSQYRVADPGEMFHDRFIGIDHRLYMSGASLKDVGKRFSVLLEITEPWHQATVSARFEWLWNASSPLG